MKFKIRWQEIRIYEAEIEAETKKEMLEIFGNSRPTNSEMVDVGIFSGGADYNILDVEKVIKP